MRKMLLAAFVVVAAIGPQNLDAQPEKAAEILKQMRAALGGDRLNAMKTLSVEGVFRRDMGGRQQEGTLILTFELPNRYHRSEEIEFPGGMSMERISVLADNKAWDDMQQRGGVGGGGGRMEIRLADGRGGPGGPGGDLNPQLVEENRRKRVASEMQRWMLAFFGAANLQPSWTAVAEAPDGKADVLEIKDERGQTVRLFVDQATHMPLMLQYSDIRPRVMINDGGRGGRGGRAGRGGGGGGREGAAGGSREGAAAGAREGAAAGGQQAGRGDRDAVMEEARRRLASMPTPQPTTFSMYLSDFKKVDGVMLPHRIAQSTEGATIEEWEIKKLKVNPPVKAELFEKK